MKIKLTFILALIIVIPLMSQLPRIVFKELWGKHFHLRKTENGEILSISSVVNYENSIYLYDMAERKIVTLDSNFTFIKEIPLETVGRNTYVGDDFIIRRNEIIFLNTVDKLLEIFNLENGNHKRSIEYPHGYFAKEPKRRHRIINKIFIDKDRIILGNSKKLFYFDVDKKEIAKGKKPVTSSKDQRFLLYGNNQLISRKKQSIHFKGKIYKPINNSFLISGKQYFILKNIMYAFTIDNTRICIVLVDEDSH